MGLNINNSQVEALADEVARLAGPSEEERRGVMRLSNVFRYVPRAIAASVCLALASMALYPGGTMRNRHTAGYSVERNFLSDLGATVSLNGQSNRLGAGLFIVSLLSLVLAMAAALAGFVALYGTTRRGRRVARLAVISGAVTCVAFIGVAAAPENAAFGLHVLATTLGFRLFPLATLLLGLASTESPVPNRSITATWLALTTVVAAFAFAMSWGPSFATAQGFLFQVIAQKTVALATVTAVAFLCVRTSQLLGRVQTRRGCRE